MPGKNRTLEQQTGAAPISSLVMIQVLSSPATIMPEQSAPKEPVYPASMVSETVYAPGAMFTAVPVSDPGNVGRETFVPLTAIEKSEATFVPPLPLTTSFITVS